MNDRYHLILKLEGKVLEDYKKANNFEEDDSISSQLIKFGTLEEAEEEGANLFNTGYCISYYILYKLTDDKYKRVG